MEILSEVDKLVLIEDGVKLTITPNPRMIPDKSLKDYIVEKYYEILDESYVKELPHYNKVGIRNTISILLDMSILHYHEWISDLIKYSKEPIK